MKYFSHLNTAVEILDLYDGKIPFHHFIKEFLKLNKKYGSKDRRSISRLCYAALRTGIAFPKWSIENRVRAGLFLCTDSPDPVTEQLIGDYNEIIASDRREKWRVITESYQNEFKTAAKPEKKIEAIFPVLPTEFSPELDSDEYLYSFFQQPDLFLRIRPGYEKAVLDKLTDSGLTFELLPPAAIRLPINTRLEELLQADREIVIQDYSSQLTGSLLSGLPAGTRYVWDACAASGGKSLLVADMPGKIRLTVTDIRSSIIFNLEKRFLQAGIKNYHAYVADLAGESPLPFDQQQDLVIADVPCSGSGTWSRTPEQLSFFNSSSVDDYQYLQQKILHRIVPMIKPGGFLLFITCSVFRKENEDNIDFLLSSFGMKLLDQKLIKGYRLKADTMFAGLLQKSDE
ncbi:MAG: Fmu (Sun) domain-containing protein [Chitinophagaceae bacterium]|nr:MAG: Fmu (Sun) domain-containing protein [Chitinophagaceae bacterium]